MQSVLAKDRCFSDESNRVRHFRAAAGRLVPVTPAFALRVNSGRSRRAAYPCATRLVETREVKEMPGPEGERAAALYPHHFNNYQETGGGSWDREGNSAESSSLRQSS